jgi:hypothetical protein
MPAIKYQNIPFKMPRTDVGGGKSYYMTANNVSISHSANLTPQRVLTSGQKPEMRLAGAVNTKIQATFPICNKFLNDSSSDDSFNFASGILTYLTGDVSTNLTIGSSGQVFSGCYLDSCSIQIEPFQSAVMSASFTCTIPLTGVPFVGTESYASPTGITNKFAYGHLAEISGGSVFSDSNQSSMAYSVECKRTYSFSVSNRNASAVFLDEVSKKLTIKSTNIANFINETGIASSVAVLLKNNGGELVLPTGTIYMSPDARLMSQDLTVQGGGILGVDVTIDELIL